MILNLEIILSNSKNNYEIYLSNFSVDKLLDKLKIEQSKYFSTLREILNKIFTYSITVPISISATLLGMININSKDPFLMFIIVLSFSIFAFVSIYYQYYLYTDIKQLEIDFEKESDIIIRESKLICEIRLIRDSE